MNKNTENEIAYLKQQSQEFLIKRILELESHIEDLYNQIPKIKENTDEI